MYVQELLLLKGNENAIFLFKITQNKIKSLFFWKVSFLLCYVSRLPLFFKEAATLQTEKNTQYSFPRLNI